MTDPTTPNGWTSCQLGTVLTLINGRAYKKPEMLDAGTPILRIQNLNGGENWFYSDLNLQPDKYCEKGDLLYAWSATFGPYWSRWDHKLIFHYHIWKILPSSAMDKRFAYYELLRITEDLKASAHGVAMPHITKSGMESWSITLPPIAEQKVIADKLDTLLAQVENTKARLERIPKILKRFRQSVLAAAVSGRLTEEWRDQNSVSITDWDALTVGDVATVATGKTPSRKEPKYWKDGDMPWLTSASTGAIYTESAEQFVTKRAVDECSLKVFPPGTLLLAMYGEGKTRGQVTELRLSATCNQACAAVTADEQKILRSYLKLRLLENYEETRKAAAGGAQPNLNLNKVRVISISVPDEKEQTEIVRRVDQLFAHADRIEQQVNNALARVNNLTPSILAKAFRGELTEQWRKENPELISGENSAEALLERIKAERAAMKPVKKTRSKPTTV
ncbi:restriction endonuclease EcoKI subunit S [Marinobacter sp. CP1]|jgi:type I restriction enzyme S subunit|uniref:restriction endonuclease subunit S n=1 Tax=Marinobacter sp. CP1 TaxID=1671721 RepID=UPI00069EE798|nr:restriction endonuclease subunit S [Marinobacter sp. CP1]AKV96250.1 restriction endonuclease EcoKI subunit S [Marinobacter sp. CP1]